MNIRLDFWRDPSRWPRDTASHVFLARAVHEMGKSLFSAEWTGGEPCVHVALSEPRGHFADVPCCLQHEPRRGASYIAGYMD
jgi:hypothetical protein